MLILPNIQDVCDMGGTRFLCNMDDLDLFIKVTEAVNLKKHIKFCISRMNAFIITKFIPNVHWVRVDFMI